VDLRVHILFFTRSIVIGLFSVYWINDRICQVSGYCKFIILVGYVKLRYVRETVFYIERHIIVFRYHRQTCSCHSNFIIVFLTYRMVILRVSSHVEVCLEVKVKFSYVSFRLLYSLFWFDSIFTDFNHIQSYRCVINVLIGLSVVPSSVYLCGNIWFTLKLIINYVAVAGGRKHEGELDCNVVTFVSSSTKICTHVLFIRVKEERGLDLVNLLH
jgi:hypothetical protein